MDRRGIAGRRFGPDTNRSAASAWPEKIVVDAERRSDHVNTRIEEAWLEIRFTQVRLLAEGDTVANSDPTTWRSRSAALPTGTAQHLQATRTSDSSRQED